MYVVLVLTFVKAIGSHVSVELAELVVTTHVTEGVELLASEVFLHVINVPLVAVLIGSQGIKIGHANISVSNSLSGLNLCGHNHTDVFDLLPLAAELALVLALHPLDALGLLVAIVNDKDLSFMLKLLDLMSHLELNLFLLLGGGLSLEDSVNTML